MSRQFVIVKMWEALEKSCEEEDHVVFRAAVDGLGQSARDSSGWTAMHFAAFHDRPVFVSWLYERGCDIFARSNTGLTPIHLASKANADAVVELLVEAGACLDCGDNERMTPLHHAAWMGCNDAAKALVEGGARLDVRDIRFMCPLHWAAKGNHSKVVKTLLNAGANPSVMDSFGFSPATVAQMSLAKESLELLQQWACRNFLEDGCPIAQSGVSKAERL
jgi:ankyrin repeat protein